MSTTLSVIRVGPLTTIQDAGRFGMLAHGISASGPMDRGAFDLAGRLAGGGNGAIEITAAGIELVVTAGACTIGFAGGSFLAHHNDTLLQWPGRALLAVGDRLAITPGTAGNFGYLRFAADLVCASVLGSIATSTRASLGGHHGRALVAGDVLALSPDQTPAPAIPIPDPVLPHDGPIRVTWGLHADLFSPAIRQRFLSNAFAIGRQHDRMGIRLADPAAVFADASSLSLVSEAIVPGDIQILGDGTPIILMRDHQPTGGYPRIATVITADFDRLAQLRPGAPLSFVSVTPDHAQSLLRKPQP